MVSVFIFTPDGFWNKTWFKRICCIINFRPPTYRNWSPFQVHDYESTRPNTVSDSVIWNEGATHVSYLAILLSRRSILISAEFSYLVARSWWIEARTFFNQHVFSDFFRINHACYKNSKFASSVKLQLHNHGTNPCSNPDLNKHQGQATAFFSSGLFQNPPLTFLYWRQVCEHV